MQTNVFVLYSDFGQVLNMLLVVCIRGEGGTVVDGWVNGGGAEMAKQAWTAEMTSFMIDEKPLLVLELLGSEEWAESSFGFCFVFRFFFAKRGARGMEEVSQIFIVCYDIY